MSRNPLPVKTIVTICVILCAATIAILFIVGTWHINFWPTDAEAYYIDAALKVPTLKFVSQMHEMMDRERIRWLHGKEMFMVTASIFQILLNDTLTLRPLILVCILGVGFSMMLVYGLAAIFWGWVVGLACFLIFATSFWPYVYILFVKHQPLGMLYFLLSLTFLMCANRYRINNKLLYFISGYAFCLSLYSSTTSGLYLPYYIAGFLYAYFRKGGERVRRKKSFVDFLASGILTVIGFSIAFLYFNIPNIAKNIRGFFEYAEISKSFSHFYYNQPVFIQWVAHPELTVRGGWLWIFKYFALIMPVFFWVYLFSIAYLLWRCLRVKRNVWPFRLTALGMIALSFSSPLLAEYKGVAQYGSNYFTSFLGFIMLVGYALHVFLSGDWFKNTTLFLKRVVVVLMLLIFALHAAINLNVFFKDIFPSRMATTFLTDKIEKLGIKDIYSYMNHPCRLNMIDCLNPKVYNKLHFIGINNIYQVPEGYILLPPSTGSSIYIDVTRNSYNDFDQDIYLNQLFRSGKIKDYAVFSCPTLSASPIWRQEEEVLSYKDLILNHFKGFDYNRNKVWLLDAGKLRRDMLNNSPSPADQLLIFNGIRNIGTKTMMYTYEGENKHVERPTLLKSFVMRITKVGEPADGLVAYIYKLAKEEPVWVPLSNDFASSVLESKDIPVDFAGGEVKFKFPKPLILVPGPYRILVYRTGKPNDEDFYRIHLNNPELTEAAVNLIKF